VANVLSKEEMEALHHAFNAGAVAIAEDPAARSKALQHARPYDFGSGALLSARPRALFQNLHDRYARSLGRVLGRLLNVQAEVRVAELDAFNFGNWESRLENNGVILTLRLDAFKGRALLAIPPSFGAIIIELMMGGPGNAETLDRPFSEVEQETLEEVIGPLVAEWQAALKRVRETNITIEERVTNKQLLRFVPEDETVVGVMLEVHLKETTALLALCYSATVVEQIAEMVAASAPNPVTAGPEKVGPECIDNVPVEVQVYLEPVLLPLREVIALQAGDVLVFDHQVERPLDLQVGSRTYCEGFLGAHGDRLAFAVSRRM
jgi:flagellar motor switch protein FliM